MKSTEKRQKIGIASWNLKIFNIWTVVDDSQLTPDKKKRVKKFNLKTLKPEPPDRGWLMLVENQQASSKATICSEKNVLSDEALTINQMIDLMPLALETFRSKIEAISDDRNFFPLWFGMLLLDRRTNLF